MRPKIQFRSEGCPAVCFIRDAEWARPFIRLAPRAGTFGSAAADCPGPADGVARVRRGYGAAGFGGCEVEEGAGVPFEAGFVAKRVIAREQEGARKRHRVG